MPTTVNNQLAALVSQQDQISVTAVANAGTLTVTINSKNIQYVCTGTDTTTTAASALLALLQASTFPEFVQQTYTSSGAVITAVAAVAGTPFTTTVAGAGGSTLTHSTTVANSSPSDPGNSLNWLRNGVAALPQAGDDVVLQNSTIPWLWNLAALAAVQFNSLTR